MHLKPSLIAQSMDLTLPLPLVSYIMHASGFDPKHFIPNTLQGDDKRVAVKATEESYIINTTLPNMDVINISIPKTEFEQHISSLA